ncbi:MAG: TIGR04282 family arsenosugar biosynthesis glycosyltransferase [Deltaproteobacteria bacterium]|nr:TIGR04282 family arsenosugar biosynthesis glycosyltransferase [Deltaproteobacteria bacterium]
MSNRHALIIFAKAPVAGQVKTRLQTHLSAEECAELHASFIMDAIRIAYRIEGADIFISCHPGVENPFFHRVSSDFGIRLMPQNGNDLGERMSNAMKDTLSAGYKKVIIIGSDSPDLPPEYIQEGFRRLDSSDMVIGPSTDGGYYLIGGIKELPVFDGIPWSGNKVFEMTLKKAGGHCIIFSVLNEWHDIDTWEDLQRFRISDSGFRVQANQKL